jgi:hypothetical protein
MKKEMNKEREYLNYVYNMITDKNYDVAKNRIDELRKDKAFRTYRFEIEYLSDYLEEQKVFYGSNNERIQEFLSGGRDALYYGDIDEALDYFSAGAYVTEYPLFYYMVGKTLYMTFDRKEEGVKVLEEYLDKMPVYDRNTSMYYQYANRMVVVFNDGSVTNIEILKSFSGTMC